jgi:hypothetical protein
LLTDKPLQILMDYISWPLGRVERQMYCSLIGDLELEVDCNCFCHKYNKIIQ